MTKDIYYSDRKLTDDSDFTDGNAFEQIGDVRYYHSLIQGCPEWFDMRRGMLTASTMDKVITPATLKIANNKDTRTSIYELAAARVTDIPANTFVSYAMERGNLEEGEARIKYSDIYAPAKECGFIINESLGFPVGFSPDGLVGDDGGIEVKSRDAKFQMQTIIEHLVTKADDNLIPKEFMLQVQTALWTTKRKWFDFVSYSNGFNMVSIRVEPIAIYQEKITEAAISTEAQVQKIVDDYTAAIGDKNNRVVPLKWVDHSEEIFA